LLTYIFDAVSFIVLILEFLDNTIFSHNIMVRPMRVFRLLCKPRKMSNFYTITAGGSYFLDLELYNSKDVLVIGSKAKALEI